MTQPARRPGRQRPGRRVRRSRHRARAVVLALAVALALAAAGCGGDDDEPAANPAPPTEPRSTVAPDDGEGSGSSSTSTTAPASAGPDDLLDVLVPPEAVAEGLSLDPSVGTGAFEPELCEDLTVTTPIEEQASQALSAGEGADGLIATQAVLRTADVATAEALVEELVAGWEECLGGGVADLTDAVEAAGAEADDARLHDRSGETTLDEVGLVRVGPLVSVVAVLGPGAEPVVDVDVLVALADALQG